MLEQILYLFNTFISNHIIDRLVQTNELVNYKMHFLTQISIMIKLLH